MPIRLRNLNFRITGRGRGVHAGASGTGMTMAATAPATGGAPEPCHDDDMASPTADLQLDDVASPQPAMGPCHDDDGAGPPPGLKLLEQLPLELLSPVLALLAPRSLCRLAACSKAMHRHVHADEIWMPRLAAQGVTGRGMEVWGGTLAELYSFSNVYHEPLEAELLRCNRGRQVGGLLAHVCLEFANPWPEPVWTIFGTDEAWAAAGAADGGPVALAAGGGSFTCEGYSCEGTTAGRGEMVLVALKVAPRGGATTSTKNDGDEPLQRRTFATAYGRQRSSADSLIAVLLAPGSKADRLVTIGEHVLAMGGDAPAGGAEDDDAQLSELRLKVVQVLDLEVQPSDGGANCSLREEAAAQGGYSLETTGGAIIPTTRPSVQIRIADEFDWGSRKDETAAEGDVAAAATEAGSAGGWVFEDGPHAEWEGAARVLSRAGAESVGLVDVLRVAEVIVELD
eukprot:SAG22_NODE_423_length_10665_cov_7.110543_8_plen_455_part_00